MSRLILVRHGESCGNRDRIFAMEPQALALTDLGYSQARNAAQRIAQLFQPELVVTSTFVRAHETARVIAETLRTPLALEADLHEREVGVHRGQSYDSLVAAPDYDARRPWAWKPKDGESYVEVQARAGPILDRLAEAHPNGDVVVVSHGGVMVALWAYAGGAWESAYTPPNCGIVLIEHGAGGYSQPRVLDDVGAARDLGG